MCLQVRRVSKGPAITRKDDFDELKWSKPAYGYKELKLLLSARGCRRTRDRR